MACPSNGRKSSLTDSETYVRYGPLNSMQVSHRSKKTTPEYLPGPRSPARTGIKASSRVLATTNVLRSNRDWFTQAPSGLLRCDCEYLLRTACSTNCAFALAAEAKCTSELPHSTAEGGCATR